MLKICEYCGNEFEGAGNSRYCSNECRGLGARYKLDRWRERTDYNARKKEQRHQQSDLERASHSSVQNQSLKLEARDRAIKSEEELKERIEKGDAMANLINEARHNPQSWEYWHYFKKVRLEYCESWGKMCTTTVNGISVNDDQFEDKVIMSIHENGAFMVRG